LDLTIHQSPAILASDRHRGTTGAVLWEVSPVFAGWLIAPDNSLFTQDVLGPQSVVLELGCGIAGVIAITLASRVGKYIATDQDYVLRTLKQNIEENSASESKEMKGGAKSGLKDVIKRRGQKHAPQSTIEVMALDWEMDSLASLPALIGGQGTVDAVIACDCIYNEALIDPFVQTCADICALRAKVDKQRPTVCIVAQQLRSSDVFEAWAKRFHQSFRFWRLPDELLNHKLRSDTGFSVHLGILREAI
jgi:hypothetical protein